MSYKERQCIYCTSFNVVVAVPDLKNNVSTWAGSHYLRHLSRQTRLSQGKTDARTSPCSNGREDFVIQGVEDSRSFSMSPAFIAASAPSDHWRREVSPLMAAPKMSGLS
jgi:hypothetical protein